MHLAAWRCWCFWPCIVYKMAHPGRQPSPGGTAPTPEDIEKHPATPTESSAPAPLTVQSYISTFWSRLASWGVELRGIVPVDLKDRTDRNVFSLFVLWFTISCNLLPLVKIHTSCSETLKCLTSANQRGNSVITGMVGTLSLKLSLRDASLVIIFFNLLCTVPPAYLSVFGPKTGMRQMIQARYSYGYAHTLPKLIPPPPQIPQPGCMVHLTPLIGCI